MEKITFVLPIKGEKDILRTSIILLPSIEHFFNLDDISDFFIIYHESEYEILTEKLYKFTEKLNIIFVNENDIIIDLNTFSRLSGWKKQQLLKLEISKLCKTKSYITLDSDLFMIKNCSIKDLLKGENKYIYNISSFECHKKWWVSSCKLLDYDLESMKDKLDFGVTPSILITDIVSKLLNTLDLQTYDIFLLQDFYHWTEYTLYWSYVVNNNYDIYYNKNNKEPLYGYSIWFKPDNDISIEEIVNEIIDKNKNTNSFFSLVQSTSNLLYHEEDMKIFIKLLIKHLT